MNKAKMTNRMLMALLIWSMALGMVGTSHILIIPDFFPSVRLYMTNLAQGLANAGHEVSFVLPSSLSATDIPAQITRRGLNITYYKSDDNILFAKTGFAEEFVGAFMSQQKSRVNALFDRLYKCLTQLVHDMLNDADFVDSLKRTGIDVIIVNAWDVTAAQCMLPLMLSVPFIQVTSMFKPWEQQLPTLPSAVPGLHLPESTERMSFTLRLQNTFQHFWYYTQNNPGDAVISKEWKKFFPNTKPPSVNAILNKADLTMFNMDSLMGYPLLSVPNIQYVGGLSIAPVNPISDEMAAILDSYPEGVVLVSFGSFGHSMPTFYMNKILSAFGQLKLTFLMRYMGDSKLLPKNIKAFEWLPQNDLLAHPKVKLFINHCGNNGQLEGLYHGVPMVGIPLFVDQGFNGRRIEYNGYGKWFDVFSGTEEHLRSLIAEVWSNKTYTNNIRKASAIFRDYPGLPRERAMYWIEHVIKFKGQHLRPYSQDMPLYHLWMLDILLLCAVSCVLLTGALTAIIYLSFRFFQNGLIS